MSADRGRGGPILLAESHAGILSPEHDNITVSLAKRCMTIGCKAGVAFTPSISYCCFIGLEIDMSPKIVLTSSGWLGGTRYMWQLARLGLPMYGSKSHLFGEQVEAWLRRLAVVGRDIFDLDFRYPGEVPLHQAALVSMVDDLARGVMRKKAGLIAIDGETTDPA